MTKRAQLPDGTILEFPDETPDAVMDRAVKSHIAQQPRADFGNVQSQSNTKGDFSGGVQSQADTVPQGYWQQRMGEAKALGNGIRYNIAETALGLSQPAASALDAIAPRSPTMAGLITGQAPSRRAEVDAQVPLFRERRAQAQREAADASPRGADFFSGGDVVGSLVQTAAPVGKLATTGKAAYGLAGLAGGVYGATRPTGEGESRLENTAIGAGAGLVGQGLGHGVAALGHVAPKAARDVFSAGQDRGVNLTFAQMSDSDFVKRMAHLSDRLPFSGATKRTAEQVKAVNKGVANEIGAKVNADGGIDAGVMARRYRSFGPQFDAVFNGGMQMDAPFLQSVAGIWQKAGDGLDDAAVRSVDSWLRRIQDQGSSGKLSGDTLRSLDRALREAGQGGSDRALVAREFREALHDAFGRQAPPGVKPAWDKLRQQYSNFLKIEPVVARNPEGPLPPTQLLGAIGATGQGKRSLTRGRAGEMGDLAMIGRRMRGPQTSGSPEGVQTAAVGYGLMANPFSTLGLLATGNLGGRALNSNGLAKLMLSEGRGNIAPFAPYARPLPFLLSGPAYSNEPERP